MSKKSDDSLDIFDDGQSSEKSSDDVAESFAKNDLGIDDVTKDIEHIAKKFQDPNSAMAFIDLIDGTELQYEQKTNIKCPVCKSEFREQVEKIYIENGKNLKAAQDFFVENGINIKKQTLYTHLKQHCDFSSISISLSSKIEAKMQEMKEHNDDIVEFCQAGATLVLEDLFERMEQCDNSKDAAMLSSSCFKGLSVMRDLKRLKAEIDCLVPQDQVESCIENMIRNFNNTLEKLAEKMPSDDARKVILEEIKNQKNGE